MDFSEISPLVYLGVGLIAIWFIGQIFLKLSKWALKGMLVVGVLVLIAEGLRRAGVISLDSLPI